MSYLESLDNKASTEKPYSKHRHGSQVPHDIADTEEGLENRDGMELDDGGWCKLPSQR